MSCPTCLRSAIIPVVSHHLKQHTTALLKSNVHSAGKIWSQSHFCQQNALAFTHLFVQMPFLYCNLQNNIQLLLLEIGYTLLSQLSNVDHLIRPLCHAHYHQLLDSLQKCRRRWVTRNVLDKQSLSQTQWKIQILYLGQHQSEGCRLR